MTDTSFHPQGHDQAGHDHGGYEPGSADRGSRSAAALDGAAPAAAVGLPAAVDTALIEDIEEALRDVVDPELGVNIVDLGLVYDLTVDPANTVTIDMTLTSAACPLTDMIEDQVGAALMSPGQELVADYRINWVWLPPWGPEKITDDGREQLRALGFNI